MSIQAVAWVLDHSESRGLARLVLISLANAVNKDANGECWPSMRTIAGEAGVSLGVIPSKIEELVELGEVEVVDRGTQRKSARYRLTHLSVQETNAERSPDELTVQPRSEQNRKEPSTPSLRKVRTQLFEAFYEFWSGSEYSPDSIITDIQRGRINKAVKDALNNDIAADEVRARGRRYGETWSAMERTPQALLLHWHRFEPDKPVPECGSCENTGLIWVLNTGEPTSPDDPDATTAVPCPDCVGAA